MLRLLLRDSGLDWMSEHDDAEARKVTCICCIALPPLSLSCWEGEGEKDNK